MAYTTIDKPTDYFNTKLYSGNGSTNAITGVGFQPDWVWCKARSYNDSNFVFDAVRGATKHLQTNSNSAEVTNANSLTAFGTDGFTLGSDGGANSNGDTYASWNWLASNTTASNTQGDIASTVSANTTSGFSIVSYTGTGSQATVGHGLGATPKWIVVKRLQNAEDWAVYHASNGAGTYQSLNTTEAIQSNSNRFNVAPTSSVFTVNTHESVNFAENYIAYCFAEKKGYSKFGSYVGNGNADGTFVYTGFKPAFVIIKRSSGIESWYTFDNKRDTSNVVSHGLVPNQNIAEFDADALDFTSNGFKIRTSAVNYNTSGDTYIYMAFAENPFVTSSGIPACAR